MALLFLIPAFACATPYQAKGLTGGYSDTRLDQHAFKVSFRGNGYTSAERASNFCLLQCAELALANDCSFFVIADEPSYQDYSAVTTPQTTRTTASASVYGNTAYGYSRSTTYGGQTFLISKTSGDYLHGLFPRTAGG